MNNLITIKKCLLFLLVGSSVQLSAMHLMKPDFYEKCNRQQREIQESRDINIKKLRDYATNFFEQDKRLIDRARDCCIRRSDLIQEIKIENERKKKRNMTDKQSSLLHNINRNYLNYIMVLKTQEDKLNNCRKELYEAIRVLDQCEKNQEKLNERKKEYELRRNKFLAGEQRGQKRKLIDLNENSAQGTENPKIKIKIRKLVL